MRSGSGGTHLYWSLNQPVAVAELEPANRRLAELLGADQASADAARILRPPFTLNYKSSPPSPVRLEQLNPRRTYTLTQVVGQLSSPPLAAPALDRRTSPRLHHDDPLRSIPPRAYFQALLGVQVPRDGKIRCPFHPDRTPSLHVYATPERGWHCFGCRRGGTIYDLAAELWGVDTRGPHFLLLRRKISQALARAAAER